ncbi:TetR/AcrR family transcriptional regulator [Microbispora sp. H10830]|uniref:TetR/AcrR family transcriptional regulator n=1 Tax=Microbispora sp. H10830 TaxID=2729109 RepID=UPI00160154B7|nr:TetR/AcrR family transcriptional regulator [Microbispora sp. H10830]
MTRRPAPGTRRRILQTAARLFGEQGARAVGMQQIVEETGLGKSVLYREFTGKDDLVKAWVGELHDHAWSQLDSAIARHEGDPARQLLAIVEHAQETARTSDAHGCTFYNTSAEYRDPDHPGRREAVAHLDQLRERLRALAATARATDPGALADMLMLIISGLYANAATLGPSGPVARSVAAARILIDQHIPAHASAS